MAENPEPWDKGVPADLIPAVKYLRKSFEEVHWGCGLTTKAFCYPLLHGEALEDSRNEYQTYLTHTKARVGPTATQSFHALLKQGTAPAIFKAFYDLYLEGVSVQALAIFRELIDIGRANEECLGASYLEWAEAQAKHMIRSHSHVIRIWVRDVCDKQVYNPNEDPEEQLFWRKWQAPMLLIMEPSRYQPYDAARAWERNDAESSSRLLDSFANNYVLHVEIRLEKAAGSAALELARQPRPIQINAADNSSHVEGFPPVTTAERRDTPINIIPAQKTGTATAVTEKRSGKADRRAAIDSYVEEVFKRTGKRITRADIWRAARYKTRTEFERWQRCDSKTTKAADERFTRILNEKPHLQ